MQAFRAIFAHPGSRGMTAAAFVGRFPMAMLGLALTLLVVTETGSYATAGVVAASLTLAGAVGGPLGARLADRLGQHRVIPPLLAVHVLSVASLTVAVMAGLPEPLWLVLGGIAGLTGPNLGAMVRARWAGIAADQRELGSAFALESTLDEVAFVLGPPLATGLAVLVAPWSAVAAGLLLAAGGGLSLAAQRRTEPAPSPRRDQVGPPIWRSTTLRLLTAVMLLMGAVFGALEVSTVAFARERAALAATGWLLGVFALSSGLTGLYLGARPGGWALSRQLVVGAGMLAVAAAALPFLDSLAGYALGMFATGLGVSAVMIGSMQIIERVMPRGRLTESLALAISGVLVGSAGAVALAGALIDVAGSRAGIAVGSSAAAAGLIVLVLARGHLARAEVLPGSPADGPGSVVAVAAAAAAAVPGPTVMTSPAAARGRSADGTDPPG